jgi:hypothetical protein
VRRVAVAAVVALLLIAAGAPAYALFTDDASVASRAFNAGTLLPPTAIGCANDTAAGGVIISWTATTGAAAHKVEIDSLPGGGGTWIDLGTAAVGATSLKIAPAQLASLLSLGASYNVRVVAVAGTSWRSAPSAVRVVQTISALGLVLGAACSASG